MPRTFAVLIYAAATTNEKAALFTRRLKTLMKGARVPGNVRVALELHAKGAHWRMRRTGDWLEAPTALPRSTDASKESTLRQFLDFGTADPAPAPADTLLFILADGAALDGGPEVPAPSSGPDRRLHVSTIRSAIQKSRVGRLGVMGFNVCVMGSLEIAFELRDVVDMFVASQEPGRPWPYSTLIHSIAPVTNRNPKSLADLVVQCVVGAPHGLSASAVATRNLGGLVEAFQDFGAALEQAIEHDPLSIIDPVLNDIVNIDFYADVGDVLSTFENYTALRSVSRAAKKAMARYLACGGRRPSPSLSFTGLSVFLPYDSSGKEAHPYGGVQFAGSPWASFVEKLLKALV